jgi:hypothetical protein
MYAPRCCVALALLASLPAAAAAAASAEGLIHRDGRTDVVYRGANGKPEAALRCAVAERSVQARAAAAQQLGQFRNSAAYAISAAPGGGAVNVPVWFHVVYKTDRKGNATGNVSDALIQAQLAVLNDAYAGSGFSFTLGGITRTDNSRWFDGCASYNTERDMKAALAVDPANNLNAYTCNPRRLLGYAYYPDSFPETDKMHGVVLLHSSLPGGGAAPYDEGDTATHEVGHYLGLAHTFEGGCSEPGDEVADTPPEASPAYGCPVGRDTCTGGGADPILNFMDYSDDACMIEFSTDQQIRMQDITAIHRPSLGS